MRGLHLATRSATNLEQYLLLARDLGQLTDDAYRRVNEQLLEVKSMLGSLVAELRPNGRPTPRTMTDIMDDDWGRLDPPPDELMD